jgi:hypothetical protein
VERPSTGTTALLTVTATHDHDGHVALTIHENGNKRPHTYIMDRQHALDLFTALTQHLTK